MKHVECGARFSLALGLLLLTACETTPPLHIQPLNVDGRDGGGAPPSYASLMRVGAAAHAGGNLSMAVGVYRRAGELEPEEPAPFVALGNTLLDMGDVNEAIRAYNSALAREDRDPEALRGLAKAYLKTGKPELANQPLSVAYQDAPDDPKILLLIGVANDYGGNHAEAQRFYRHGLEVAPNNQALTCDLALSLAMTGDYNQAISVLRPLASSPTASPGDRQTLALIYGLQGNGPEAERLSRMDLDPASVEHNLAFYDTLRRLEPEARNRAILSVSSELPAASHS
ncbi:MAG: tetratricopeptide repeat protein [Alphaproteobacteria bacterium]|nr:tetratricopeptide repeat protein [Alphaproteobacteria bacterium]